MILDEQQERDLKGTLVKRLEPICNADPSVLSNYIIALLKRNHKSAQELKGLCKAELQDFLHEETNGFVEDMFDVLQDMEKSSNINIMIEGDPQPRKRAQSPPSPQTGLRKRRYEDTRSPDRRRRRSRSPSPKRSRSRSVSRSRIRSRSRSPSPNSRSHSRSRSRSRSRSPYSRSRSRSPPAIDRELSSKRRGRDDDSRFRKERDDRAPRRRGEVVVPARADRGRDSRRGRGGRREPDNFPGRQGPRGRRICRDFEEKGICLRGNLCPYDHFSGSVEPIVVDEASLKLPVMKRVTDSIIGRAGESIPGLDEDVGGSGYNPENPFLKPAQAAIPVWPPQQMQPIPPALGRGAPLLSIPTLPVLNTGAQFPPMLSQPPLPMRNNSDDSFKTDLSSGGPMFMSGGGRGRGRGRGGNGGMRGGRGGITGKRPYNQDGSDDDNADSGQGQYHYYNNNSGRGGRDNYGQQNRRRRFEQKKPNTESICVTRIPAELNTIEQLNGHFKKFGTIVNIQLEPSENRAFVQFSNHVEALKALRSPEAVLGNRFIQVYLKREESAESQPSAPAAPPVPQPAAPVVPVVPKPVVAAPPVIPKPRPAAPSISKQTEELKQLKKQKEELRKKQLQQQQLILEALSGMKGKSKEKEQLVAQLGALTAQLSQSMQKEKSSLEATKKKAETAAAASTSSASWKKPVDTEKDRLDRELEFISKAKEKPITAGPASPASATEESKEEEEEGDGDIDVGEDAVGETPTTTTTITTTTTSAEEPKDPQEKRVQVLKEKLSSLQSEAEALGLHTALSSPVQTGYRGGRGLRARGRGMRIRASPRGFWRGGPRGRAAMRGGARGRGAGGADPTRFRLDNRTTVISIKNLGEDVRDEGLLRAHFQTFGNILSLTVTDDNALIQFDTRREAEMAMQYGRTLKSKPLEMSWHDKLRGAGAETAATGEAAPEEEQTETTETGETEEGEVPVEVVEEYFDDEEGYYRAPGEEAEDEEEDGERSWKR